MDPLRLFIAIKLPEACQEQLMDKLQPIQRRLDPSIRARWVQPAQFHFTLKFLGACQADDLVKLQARLRASLADQRGFPVILEGLGTFPPRGKPRVLWIGVKEGKQEMGSLARRLDAACEGFGQVREDRQFSAHLTLARIAHVADPRGLQLVVAEHQSRAFGSFEASSICLMKSDLSSGSPVYSVVQTYAFKPTASGTDGRAERSDPAPS